MATISITVGAFTASKTVSTNDLNRLLAAYRTIYGQVPVDPSASPVVMRDMTNQETFDKFSSGLLQGMVDAVKRAEQQVASQSAITAVTSITLG